MGEIHDSHGKEEDYQVTHWKRPGEVIETVAGLVYYKDWCEMEVERLGKDNHYIDDKTYKDSSGNIYMCIRRIETG